MPEQQKIQKAYLQEVIFPRDSESQPIGDQYPVQFNPQSLKINYSSEKKIDDKNGGAAAQFVGKGITTLAVELLYDSSEGRVPQSVQKKTGAVIKFIQPKKFNPSSPTDKRLVPPGIRFHWGAFQFDGFVDSINETLDFFSKDGIPLRATISLNLSRLDSISTLFGQAANTPGTVPLNAVSGGQPLQQAASVRGNNNWQGIARENGIENPRIIAAGRMVIGL